MKYEAVIFDLGGTLVRNYSSEEYRNTAREMATVLAVPREEFADHWFEKAADLATGKYRTYQDYIR